MVKVRLFAFVLHIGLAWTAAARAAAAETVLLDFTAPQCPPCREMEPVLAQLADHGHVIRQIDVTREGDVAREFRVDATPTFIVLVDGREWARLTGKSDYATMEGMIRKATEMAAARGPAAAGPAGSTNTGAHVTPVSTLAGGASSNRPDDARPREGLVTPMRDPFAAASSTPAAQASAPGPATPAVAPAKGSEPAIDASQLIAATVRLSITDPGGKSTGTGAIVDARNGRALVLTCGHLFRESAGRGPIEVSLFVAGPNGAELRGTAPAELLDYDLKRDLALVRFEIQGDVPVTPIAPLGTQLEPGAAVTSVGCSHGENPTAWSTHITTLNRYQGYPNVEAARAPVEGRSGGPLFNAQGQVIGVCFAANPEDNEGLYASLASIHAKLDELQMSTVYQAPGIGGEPTGQLASAPSQPGASPDQFEVRGQNPMAPPASALPGGWPATDAPATSPRAEGNFAGLTSQERATIEEIARRSGGSEVICIIRPQTPEGRSDVIKLGGVSADFVRALTASAQTATLGPGGATAPGGAASAGMMR